MGPTDILKCVFALYGTDGNFNMRFSLIWDRRTFYHTFLPYMGPTDTLTCVFALYGTFGNFNAVFTYMGPTDILTCVFALNRTDGYFNMRFCLIWDRRTF